MSNACSAGDIPMLVLALSSGANVAAEAFKVIAILLSPADLPAEQVNAAEAQLVRMQAVPRLCCLLKADMRTTSRYDCLLALSAQKML